MHELGLCASIIDAVESRAGTRPVARVKVRVGRLHHVHPEAFEQSFTVAAMGTVAENAVAELVLLPVGARCGACGASWDDEAAPVACPTCGGPNVQITSGDELLLESIEYRS